jgi:DNA-binding XRE family transcriptional regulator
MEAHMRETINNLSWWVTCGYPAFGAGRDGFPKPGHIIRYYRQRKQKDDGQRWTQKDLANALHLSEQAVCLMEKKSIGVESMARRRFIAELLGIPPILLGLADLSQIKTNSSDMLWWIGYGYPAFEMGDDGFPKPGHVVRHYRQQKVKSSGKHWTQKDLARVLDLTEQAMCLIEKKGIGLENIKRRRLLAEILTIPPVLLGLAELPTLPDEHPSIPPVSSRITVDIAAYERILHACYNAHHRRASYERLSAIQETIASLYQALPFTQEQKATHLLSRYHIMIASILRDQCLFREAIEHLHRAIHLTKQIGDNEFLADAFYRSGWVYLESKEGHKAAQNFLAAEKLFKKIPSYMAGGILIGLGRSRALQAHDIRERLEALHTLDQAAKMLQRYPVPDKNWHFLEIEMDRYRTDRSAALIDMSFPRDALHELSSVRLSSNNQRRNALLATLEAQAHFSLGDFAQTCSIAEEALTLIKPIHSRVNYERISVLHRQLKSTTFGNDPEVARLGVMLDTIQVDWSDSRRENRHR